MAPHKKCISTSSSSAWHEGLSSEEEHTDSSCSTRPIFSLPDQPYHSLSYAGAICTVNSLTTMMDQPLDVTRQNCGQTQAAGISLPPSIGSKSGRRFTVSPVPDGDHSLLLLPALVNGSGKTRDVDDDDRKIVVYGGRRDEHVLLEATSPPVQQQREKLKVSPSSDSLDDGESHVPKSRCRHESEASCVTVTTIMTVDELMERESEEDQLKRGCDGQSTADGTERAAPLLASTSFGVDNPTIVLTKADEESEACHVTVNQHERDTEHTLFLANATDPEGGIESAQASQWDVSFRGLRNNAIQFFIGSTYTLRSAVSTVSFFNTLYAKGYAPICRICHQGGSPQENLETPCNCQGNLKFVHHSCLLQWLDLRSRHLRRDPVCELCQFQYRPRRVWQWRKLTFPAIPFHDKLLHILFLLALMVLLGCVGVAVQVLMDTNIAAPSEMANDITNTTMEKGGLSRAQMRTLSCGLLFFMAFSLAVSTQLKAKSSLPRILQKFITMNHVLVYEAATGRKNFP